MESVGTILAEGGEWSSCFNGVYSTTSTTTEEADFMAQLLGNCSLPNEVPVISSSSSSPCSNYNLGFSSAFCCWPSQQQESEGPLYSSDQDTTTTNNTMFSFSQGSSSASTTVCASYFPISYDYPAGDTSFSLGCYLADVKNSISNNSLMEMEAAAAGDEYLINPDVSNNDDDSMESAGDQMLLHAGEGKILEHEIPVSETSLEDTLSGTSKKRPRIPIDNINVKNKRTVKPKKNHKDIIINPSDINEDESEKQAAVLHRQHSNNCISDDDSINASQELKASLSATTSALNLNGKTRASRGSATDPQSLYARKRRERINERLRILQNLVPNGTKVDISTMLEEAVQYVKFLQLQIKLLSSDDLWMYAPIAYNGINIGLDLKIGTTPKSSS